jgi:hypothetical protein
VLDGIFMGTVNGATGHLRMNWQNNLFTADLRTNSS